MFKLNKSKITFFIILLSTFFNISAQEFEQFYTMPQYYNSAFAGIEKCSNISTNNHFHPIVNGVHFLSNNLLLDIYISEISGGLKFSLTRSSTPDNIFTSLDFAFGYSYHLKLSKKIRLALSIQTTFIQKNINSSNLIYPSSISPFSNTVIPNNEPIINNLYRNFNFASGFVLYNRKSYFSIFVDNFYSLYIENKQTQNTNLVLLTEKQAITLPHKFFINISSIIIISKNFKNFSTGMIIKNKQFKLGLFSKQNILESSFTNGLGSFLSYSYGNLTIGYTYSFYFGNIYNKKSSAHELQLKLRFKCGEKNKNNTIICPAYKL